MVIHKNIRNPLMINKKAGNFILFSFYCLAWKDFGKGGLPQVLNLSQWVFVPVV